MPCTDQSRDCQPCQDCPPTPDPILPRCNDLILPSGTFVNATVVVDNGCIIQLLNGQPMLYQPDSCCAPVGTPGEGGNGLPGPQGPGGAAATITVAGVESLAPGEQAFVQNLGTSSAASLLFGIPRGEDGTDGESDTGVTDDRAGIEIEKGVIKTLPVTWPPVLRVDINPVDVAGVELQQSKDPNGVVTMTLTMGPYDSDLRQDVSDTIAAALAPLQQQIIDLQNLVQTQQIEISTLQADLAICCPPAP